MRWNYTDKVNVSVYTYIGRQTVENISTPFVFQCDLIQVACTVSMCQKSDLAQHKKFNNGSYILVCVSWAQFTSM